MPKISFLLSKKGLRLVKIVMMTRILLFLFWHCPDREINMSGYGIWYDTVIF